MTAALTLDDVRVERPGFVLRATLEFPPGVTAVVGPNGAGKSTLLEVIAGLLDPVAGTIRHGSETLRDSASRLPAASRQVGYVPQAGILFPHLTAVDNVAFGLRARGWRPADARDRAHDWLDRVGVGDLADRRPDTLSGGQAQRVALARALVVDPALLLLDEPLAAVDAAGRRALQQDLRTHLVGFAGPAIVVTHDVVEAASLADTVVVLEDGEVTQTGTISTLARRPRTPWIARLVGVNLVSGTASGTTVTTAGDATLVVADRHDGPVLVSIPPSAVALYRQRPDGTPRNVWPVTVVGLQPVAGRLRVELEGPVPLTAEITPNGAADLDVMPGRQFWAAVKATDVEAFPA